MGAYTPLISIGYTENVNETHSWHTGCYSKKEMSSGDRATTGFLMVVVTMKMIVRPDSRMELIQTVNSLMEEIRKRKGCLGHSVYQDLEDENTFVILEEWGSQIDFNTYLRSEAFSVLCGAMKVLGDPLEVKCNEVLRTGSEG
jgi:quinol monooxygenase YgiN